MTFTFGDETAEVDWFIIAAGRGPDVEGLGLDEAGVKLDDDGLIEVDGALRTSVKGVYAIGDLVPGPALAHKASDEGIIAVEDAAGPRDPPDRVHRHPARHVLHPERRLLRADRGAGARAGATTSSSARCSTAPSAAAPSTATAAASIKIVGDKKYGELLGGHIVGSRATELIQELVNAQGARGRLPRGRAHHPRPPDAVRGGHGGRPGRRRLADPRLAPSHDRGLRRPSEPVGVPLRPGVARGVPRRRAREPRCSARCPEWVPVRLGEVGAVPLRRGGRRLPRGRRARGRARSGCRRCAGPTRSRPTASGRCWPRPTRSRSAAPSRSASPPSARRSRPGATSSERDNVLIAAAACEMHPAAVLKGAELRGTRERLEAATERGRARPACATCPPSLTRATATVIEVPRMKANRAYDADRPPRRPRARRCCARAAEVDHVEVVEIDSGEVVLFWDTTPAADRPPRRARSGPTSPASTPTSSSPAGAATTPRNRPPLDARKRRPRATVPPVAEVTEDGEPATLPGPDAAREWLAHDDAHPPLRGARGRDVREGEGRRLPAPGDRRGGDDRRRRAARCATTTT